MQAKHAATLHAAGLTDKPASRESTFPEGHNLVHPAAFRHPRIVGVEIGYFFPLIHPDSFPVERLKSPGQWVQDGGLHSLFLGRQPIRSTRNLPFLRIVHPLARGDLSDLWRELLEVGFRPDHRGFSLFQELVLSIRERFGLLGDSLPPNLRVSGDGLLQLIPMEASCLFVLGAESVYNILDVGFLRSEAGGKLLDQGLEQAQTKSSPRGARQEAEELVPVICQISPDKRPTSNCPHRRSKARVNLPIHVSTRAACLLPGLVDGDFKPTVSMLVSVGLCAEGLEVGGYITVVAIIDGLVFGAERRGILVFSNRFPKLL